ncbi:MAG TPA: SDR family NAD(P)-dependent oxidoreductase [Polyangium sp.]|nr:SDR family NAD(P)-dependent oxidoreductase [Polyangium sp.]
MDRQGELKWRTRGGIEEAGFGCAAMSFPNADDLEVWLVSRLAESRGMDARAIDPRERFHRYGLDSLGAMRLLAELSQKLGRTLPPTLVWEHPTPRALANHLTEPSTSPRSSLPSHAIKTNSNEPIAIVGMACRFPKAPSVEAYWQLLRDGVDAITEVPRDRWDAAALYDPNGTTPGKLNTRWGGFLDRVDQFDPQFFGISPREAVQMDPQQRLVLELSWEALEDAGIVPASLRDSRTGVFVGALFMDHALLQDRAGWESITSHTSTGGAACIIANRVSYALGLQGPSMTVDTASSASLVAVHLACQSLRLGESTLVLAGGVNLTLVPETTMRMGKLGTQSPTGRCRAFDAQGDGYVRGEGAGIVALKRLSDAVRDGDRIYAVIRGSAVNNDGVSNGLTAPNPKAQESLLVDAYQAAGFQPSTVDYVEAHGTGTPLGDPIEAKALGTVLSSEQHRDQKLLIGSVKTNIGHLEAAAGIAGLMKVALAMHHETIPKSLHFETPNPNIDFDTLGLRVVTEAQPWPISDGKPARAGINSFGYGGTNAHAVLESVRKATTCLTLIEGSSDETVDEAVESTLERIHNHDLDVGHILWGPAKGSGQRIAAIADNLHGLTQRLDEVRIGADGPGIFRGKSLPNRRLVWVFSGQGSQWEGMGRTLVHDEPVFRAALIRCDRELQPLLGWSVLDEFIAGCPRATAERVDITWPLLFAFQVSVADLLREWGLEPAAIVGHSIGEVSAAQVAGVLSLRDAARVIAAQSKLVQKSAGKGAMLVAAVGWSEALTIAAASEGKIHCAISASPKTSVFSGDIAAIGALEASLQARGIFTRPVQASVAVHGPRVDYLRLELPRHLLDFHPNASTVPIVSSILGGMIQGENLDADYWSRQLREPVRFAGSIQHLLNDGFTAFLEIAPHPIVKESIEECIAHTGKCAAAVAVATNWRHEDEGRSIREALGTLFVNGVQIINRAETERKYREEYVYLLPVSGQIDLAMRHGAKNLADFMERHSEISLRDISYLSSVRRTHHRTRAVVMGRTRGQILDGLRALAERRENSSIRTGTAPVGGRPGLVFVFPGQGSQWVGMGRTLFSEKSVFREMVVACDAIIQRESEFSVIEELFADEANSQLTRIDVVQPTLVTVQIALAALWRSWGVEPDCVIGHSMGEIAAAHVAGILSLDDALRIICRRSRLLKRIAGMGAMASVELSLAETERLLAPYPGKLSVAVSNGPRTTVISGDPTALDDVLAKLSEREIFVRRVNVDVASHSPQVDSLLDDLSNALEGLRPRPGTLKMRSTVTGELVFGAELDKSYWLKNLRAPVLFGRSVAQAIGDGQTLFLEISPHPILLHSIEDTLREMSKEGAAIASLRRHESERRGMVDALGSLHVHGHELAWNRLYPLDGRCTSLPTYPWQRDRYWLPDDIRARLPSVRHTSASTAADPDAHPLLGTPLMLAIEPTLHVWESILTTSTMAHVAEYRIQGDALLPDAAYIEMILTAFSRLSGNIPFALEEIIFDRSLQFLPEIERHVQTVLNEETPDQRTFRISSRETGGSSWTQHVSGKIRSGLGLIGTRIARDRPRVIQSRCPATMTSTEFYAQMENTGRSFGKGFRSIETFWLGPNEGLARCYLHPDHFAGIEKFQAHPALLDACIQALIGVHLASSKQTSGTFVVARLDRLRIHRPLGVDIWIHAEKHPTDDPSQATGDVFIVDAEGRLIAEFNGLRIKLMEGGKSAGIPGLDDAVYAVEWRKKDLDTEPARVQSTAGAKAWLVFVDEGGTAAAMSFLLVARGEACIRVRRGTKFARIEAGLYEIEPGNPEHYHRLLRETFGREIGCKGIVHLFALDSAAWDVTTTDTIAADIERGCLSVLYLVQAMARQGWRDMPRLWLATRGAQAVLASGTPLCVSQSTLWGLGRTIALEHPEVECTRIDMDPTRGADEASLLWREISARCREDQVAYRKEGRFVARIVKSSFEAGDISEARPPVEPANGRPFRLECVEMGVLERLHMRESPRRAPGVGEVEIRVEAAGLNFPDIMGAMGMVPGAAAESLRFGYECAGHVVAVGPGVENVVVGQPVVAFAPGSLGSHVTTLAEFVAPKPSKCSFVEAASLPVVFMTVYYALNKLVRLGQDERILIHTAAGGTGLAAIQMARVLQAEIFATAGNDEKRAYLRSIGIDHVMDSRSLSFAAEIMDSTAGQGVDVVLNTLTGDARARSLELLAPYGRFVELSKRDILLNTQMPALRRSVSFASVDLPGMALERPALLGSLLREVTQLFEMGVFQPLPLHVFPANDVRSAFQFMAQAKHIGKVVIDMSDPMTQILPADRPRRGIRAEASYLITGGLGSLGLSLAQWMVEQGARQLVLLSRKPPSATAREAISRMEKAGAHVVPVQADVTDKAQMATVFSHIEQTMPPLRGIVHAAGTLDDRTLLDMDADRFLHVMAPKVVGAFHLHSLCQNTHLDFFVLFSSVASLLGAPGQANYAAGNAFLDGLAHARRRAGLAGTSIHWAPFTDIGHDESHSEQEQRMSHRGIEGITSAQGLFALSRLLERPRAEVAILRLSLHQWLDFYPHVAGSPYWSELQRERVADRNSSTQAAFRQILERKPASERLSLLEEHVLEHVGHVFRLDTSRVDRLSSFKSLGMDSFLSLELRNRLEFSLGVRLSATLLFTYPNPASLADYLLERINIGATKQRTTDTGAVLTTGSTKQGERSMGTSSDATMPASVAIRQMSVAEAELLLEEELARSEDYLQ